MQIWPSRGNRIGRAVVLAALAGCGSGGGDHSDAGPGPVDGGTPPPGEAGAGLILEVRRAQIDPTDGSATVTVVITDGAGVPITRGIGEEGGVQLSLAFGWLAQDDNGEPGQYTAYTTREQSSPITGDTAVQAAADAGGSWSVIDANAGLYRYRFGASAAGFDPTLTHTVAIWGRRSFDSTEYTAADTYHFRPDGGDVTVVREVVVDKTCEGCHGTVTAHGGQRQGTQQCILCHSPQSVDPDTGNTVDFKVMVHKIHAGEQLPSVEAGGMYAIIGFMQGVHDFSDVRFPRDLRDCDGCHGDAPQGDFAFTRPGQAACGTCPDNAWFGEPPAPAGMVAHPGGPQADDQVCIVCHPAQGGLEGVRDNHVSPTNDPDRPRVALSLVDIVDTGPGQQPTVTFDVAVDDEPRDIAVQPLDGLRLTFAGPNSDYARFWQVTVLGAAPGGALAATATPGRFQFIVGPEGAIPADASGSYTVGMEGYVMRGDVR
ncbi:MAG TPA: OmcA/MtrC family decaheme c-type cytochrome, partial [Kofleriaceae bacterium]|nr:OmcA/MtrC family decaheme c-type cytochrome [Kofleriaceae bacterium]